MKITFDHDDCVTRVDTRDTDDGTEVRMFHKRKLLHRFGEDDVSREGWEDEIAAFLAEKPRTVEAVEDFLTAEAGDEDEEEERDSGSVVPDKYRIIYGASQNCGDAIAVALTAFVTTPRATKKDADGGLDRAKLRAVAEINGIGDKLASWEERDLNGGLLRMNTSNVLRGMNRRGEKVEIGSEVWAAREVPKKERAKRPSKAKAAKPAK